MVMVFTVAALNQKQGGMSTGKTDGCLMLSGERYAHS